MSTIIRATSAADLVLLIPRLLGFTPVESLVLVPFDGGRSLGGLRADLPDAADTDHLDQTASTLIGMVCKVARADGVAAVVFTGRSVNGGERPHRPLVDAVLSRAHICGLRVVDALVVGSDSWATYLGSAAPTAHPRREGERLHDDLPDVPLARDQRADAELPAVGALAQERIARLIADMILILDGDPDAVTMTGARLRAACVALDALSDPPDLFETAIEGDATDLEAPLMAAIVFALARPLLRDVALAQWAADLATGDAVFRAQTGYVEGRPFPPDLALSMIGEGPAPDRARVGRAIELCRRAAASAPREHRPGALAAAAWLAWALGHSTHAAEYASRAREIDPRHGLSEIVLTMVAHGRLPEWAFEPSASSAAAPTSPAGTGSSRGSRDR